jgi:hypothetical protein
MTTILLSINFINFILFRNHWKKLFYLFIFFIPYLGYIQLKISYYTVLAPLIHDFIFIIPLYLIFIFTNKRINILPNDLKRLIFIFILLLIIQLVNPYNELSFVSRLVGLKVWIFYFFLIVIGYNLITNTTDLKKFCNFFSLSALIPCLIGNLLYLLCLIYGYREIMTLFYNDASLAFSATQKFAQFDYGSFKYYRIPSTFSYSTQYLNFCLLALMTTITSIFLSNTLREKRFYKYLLILIIISSFFTGNRGSALYLIIFFLFFSFQHYTIKDIKFLLSKILIFFMLVFFIYKNLPMAEQIVTLGQSYAVESFFKDFGENLSAYFLGAGLGNATAGVRYISITDLKAINEGFYWKIIVELGIPGLLIVLFLFFNYIRQIKIAKIRLFNHNEKVLCNCFYSYIAYQLIVGFKSWVYFEGYPANFIFFLLLGIILKLGSVEYIVESNSNSHQSIHLNIKYNHD